MWRYITLGRLRTYVHVPIPRGLSCEWSECPLMPPWGNPTWPFTKALQKQVSHVQKHSDSVQSVCRLLDVRMEDLIRYDRVLNKVAPRRAPRPLRTLTPPHAQVMTVDDIPGVSHPK